MTDTMTDFFALFLEVTINFTLPAFIGLLGTYAFMVWFAKRWALRYPRLVALEMGYRSIPSDEATRFAMLAAFSMFSSAAMACAWTYSYLVLAHNQPLHFMAGFMASVPTLVVTLVAAGSIIMTRHYWRTEVLPYKHQYEAIRSIHAL